MLTKKASEKGSWRQTETWRKVERYEDTDGTKSLLLLILGSSDDRRNCSLAFMTMSKVRPTTFPRLWSGALDLNRRVRYIAVSLSSSAHRSIDLGV